MSNVSTKKMRKSPEEFYKLVKGKSRKVVIDLSERRQWQIQRKW